MQRSLAIAAIILGLVAAVGLAGGLRPLPPYIAFFVGSLAIFLFPGAALTAVAPRTSRSLSLPELLALWFALGVGALSAVGFAGLAFKTTASRLSLALAMIFGCVLALVAARLIATRKKAAPRALPLASPRAYVSILIFILVLAVGCGLLTLLTPRDVDDWYYLAYIRDFVSNHSIRSEDAILGMGQPASPRTWYASWWVAEAIVSRVTGVAPVATHQVYLPLLLVPFTVLAALMLARQIFHDHKVAAIAASLQVLFYLSSAHPYNSAGWLVFCRISQDKAVACFLMVPVAIALGLRFMHERARCPELTFKGDSGAGPMSAPQQAAASPPCESAQGSLRTTPSPPEATSSLWRSFGLYLSGLVSALLVHPLSTVWIGVGIVPFALTEALGRRSRRASSTLLLVAVPLLVSGLFLAAGMGDVSSELEAKASRQTEDLKQSPGSGQPAPFKNIRSLREAGSPIAQEQPAVGDHRRLLSLYLPGRQLPWASEEGDFATVLRRRAEPLAANPLYIARYPLALVGLILTFLLLGYVRRDGAARILFTTTLAVLILAFMPLGAALTARALTWKLVYRLSWILPWGFTIAFFITRIRVRRIPSWVLAAVLVLVLARGNPANYAKALRQWGPMLRPDREAAAALGFLAHEPSPQGVVIASAGLSRMIPAFVADAYPAAYRGSGTLTRTQLETITASTSLSDEVMSEIRQSRARYILIEKIAPLSKALSRGTTSFQLVYENRQYELWRVRSP